MKRTAWNDDWLFWQDKTENKVKVDLPHDAMRSRTRIPRLKNGALTGFFPSGDYWYEKTLFGGEEYRDQTVMLEFQGIYMDSSVYLNDELVGGRVYGYSGFWVDLTGKLRIGQKNVIRVFVHCSQVPNARWYPGNGIYRPVYLLTGSKSYIKPNGGIQIFTRSIDPARIQVKTDACMATDDRVKVEIYDNETKIAEADGAWAEIEIPAAKLWDEDTPNLYTAKVSVWNGEQKLDESETAFGIRSIACNATEGLKINGRPTKLRGGCVHHDNGVLGACSFYAAEYRKVKKLKEAGFNAIRSSHYPMSEGMLRACDKLGMYVMDEAFDSWRDNAGTYGYVLDFENEWRKDLRDMVLKDINHPSVILYSIGNEISDTYREDGIELTEEMTTLCHSLDDTRPVTICPNVMMNVLHNKGLMKDISLSADGKMPQKDDVTDPLLQEEDGKMGGSVMINILVATAPALMKLFMTVKNADAATSGCYGKVDIAGYNYGVPVYEGLHRLHPGRVGVGSETNPPDILKTWEKIRNMPYIIGDFMWTAWDYLGEGGLAAVDYGKSLGAYNKPYPIISANCGAFDLIGHKDHAGHLASIAWGYENNPYIAVRPVDHAGEKMHVSGYRGTDAIPSWSWEGCEGKKTTVLIYSVGATVELFQDGFSLGKKRLKNGLAKYKVSYRPGCLTAVSYDAQGKMIGNTKLQSAGSKTKLLVTAEKEEIQAGGQDLAYLDIALTDEQGIVKVMQDRSVTVKVEGAGTLCGIGSGSCRTEESYVGDTFTTYRGRLQAVVRSGKGTGNVSVLVTAEGLEPARLEISVK